MKVLIKFFVVVMILGLASCRDTKKEEAEAENVEKLEAVNAEVEQVTEELEDEAAELEEALKELDSI